MLTGLKHYKIGIFSIILTAGYIIASFLIYKFVITNIYSEIKGMHKFSRTASKRRLSAANNYSAERELHEIKELVAIKNGENRINSVFIASSGVFLLIIAGLSLFLFIDEKKVRDTNERYERIFKTNSAPMILVDAETGKISDANEAAIRFYGFLPAEFLGSNISVLNPYMSEAEMAHMRIRIMENGPSVIFLKHRNKDGEKKIIKYFATSVSINKRMYIIGTVIDMTEKDILESQLEIERDSLKMLPETDALTGAFNKRKFEEILTGWMNEAEKNKSGLSLVFLGIDNFNDINDNFGRKVANRILKALSEIIKSRLRITDIVSRCGGDFMIIMPETSASRARDIARTILDEASGNSYGMPDIKVIIQGTGARSLENVSISIGIAACRFDDESENVKVEEWNNGADSIKKRAYTALYRARVNGGGRIEIRRRRRK